jgi:hypothetical protein
LIKSRVKSFGFRKACLVPLISIWFDGDCGVVVGNEKSRLPCVLPPLLWGETFWFAAGFFDCL